MLDWTDNHCRYFHRLITRHTVLYTEMVNTSALIHGDRHRLLHFDPAEHPLALQLGGSNPEELALCARMAEDYGYDEVNLNVGCPSAKVQSGRFGACLMAEPKLVAECVVAMNKNVAIPISVKSRIGIDDQDSYQNLYDFVSEVASAPCDTFIIHARKAWLSGLSPKQNRETPPLRYDFVFQLKQDLPQLEIILNGGITTVDQALELLQQVDGVMIGREAYHNPFILSKADKCIFQDFTPGKSPADIAREMVPYIRRQLKAGVRLHSITRHMLGLFYGQPGSRKWKRYISENACSRYATEQIVLHALSMVQE